MTGLRGVFSGRFGRSGLKSVSQTGGFAYDDGMSEVNVAQRLPRIFAIVPAAGCSRRMGRSKQLLDVGGRTMLERVLEPLAASAAAGVLLVTRSELIERLPLALPRVTVAFNDDPDAAMIDSVRIGLGEWERRERPGPRDGFLVVPGDQPGLTPFAIDHCLRTFGQDPARIVIAVHSGRRGHPLIFPASLVPFVLSAACDQGLNQLARHHAQLVLSVECDSPAVTRNVNTPEDYRLLG